MKKLAIISVILILLAGCAAPKQFNLKSAKQPKIIYCIDTIGHIPGTKPWILGGKCCCTPTYEMFSIYQSEGTVSKDMDYSEFIYLFTQRDIVTDLTPGYKGSNNRDDHGPHVVFGGRSMVTPTPGTKNYEEVIAGKKL